MDSILTPLSPHLSQGLTSHWAPSRPSWSSIQPGWGSRCGSIPCLSPVTVLEIKVHILSSRHGTRGRNNVAPKDQLKSRLQWRIPMCKAMYSCFHLPKQLFMTPQTDLLTSHPDMLEPFALRQHVVQRHQHLQPVPQVCVICLEVEIHHNRVSLDIGDLHRSKGRRTESDLHRSKGGRTESVPLNFARLMLIDSLTCMNGCNAEDAWAFIRHVVIFLIWLKYNMHQFTHSELLGEVLQVRDHRHPHDFVVRT